MRGEGDQAGVRRAKGDWVGFIGANLRQIRWGLGGRERSDGRLSEVREVTSGDDTRGNRGQDRQV